MKDRILIALAFAMTVGPAFAVATAPTQVPEPATVTLFGAAAVGALVVRKLMGRK